jgi:hypothetical protein
MALAMVFLPLCLVSEFTSEPRSFRRSQDRFVAAKMENARVEGTVDSITSIVSGFGGENVKVVCGSA